jgi:PTS system mannose-specific IID component
VQGAWNYERMLGLGMGYSAEPLLADLERDDPERYREAVRRSASFFNCHPYLAGLALGASVRAEYDHVPGTQIERLRTALCSPLGALGDQLFWAGVLPALSAVTLVAIAMGAGVWAVAGFLVVYNTVRVLTAWWALRTGLATGTRVGAVITGSWLPIAARRAGRVAAFLVGIAIPVAIQWLLGAGRLRAPLILLALAAAGVTVSFIPRTRLSSARYGILLLCLILGWQWVIR